MTVNILSYGADPTGKASSRKAIQRAVDVCGESGGGVVTVPAGTYISGTVYFLSGVELHLECGATVVADTDFSEYCRADDYPENEDCPSEKWIGAHLFVARECENIAITGQGTIRGRGDLFYGGELHQGSETSYWREGYSDDGKDHPVRLGQTVHLVRCKNVRVTDVTFSDASCWNLFLFGCEDVVVRGITVRAGKTHANTDGIDIDCCRFVRVSDCLIDNGDDCIAIRADEGKFRDGLSHPCEYITVTNCILSDSTCAVRIGVGAGSIRHVSISDCVIPRSGEGISFMTNFGGAECTEVSDVTVSHVRGDDVGCPLQLFAEKGSIRRVTVEGFDSGCSGSVRLRGAPGGISEITLRHLCLRDRSGAWKHLARAEKERGGAIFYAQNVSGLTLDDAIVAISPDSKTDSLGCQIINTDVIGTLKGSKTVC